MTFRTSAFRQDGDDARQPMESSMNAQTTSASTQQGLAVWGLVLAALLFATTTLATITITFAQAGLY